MEPGGCQHKYTRTPLIEDGSEISYESPRAGHRARMGTGYSPISTMGAFVVLHLSPPLGANRSVLGDVSLTGLGSFEVQIKSRRFEEMDRGPWSEERERGAQSKSLFLPSTLDVPAGEVLQPP